MKWKSHRLGFDSTDFTERTAGCWLARSPSMGVLVSGRLAKTTSTYSSCILCRDPFRPDGRRSQVIYWRRPPLLACLCFTFDDVLPGQTSLRLCSDGNKTTMTPSVLRSLIHFELFKWQSNTTDVLQTFVWAPATERDVKMAAPLSSHRGILCAAVFQEKKNKYWVAIVCLHTAQESCEK